MVGRIITWIPCINLFWGPFVKPYSASKEKTLLLPMHTPVWLHQVDFFVLCLVVSVSSHYNGHSESS